MPRENSFSDSSGRSLTPELEDELDVPRASSPPPITTTTTTTATQPRDGPSSPASAGLPRPPRPTARPTVALTPGDKFRRSVRKVIALHRTSSSVIQRRGAGAEPGVDPRRDSAVLQFGHIHTDCVIEVCDYSSVRHSFGRMTNAEFVRLMQDPVAHERESWVKVRWINVGGISWDVISALALRYELHPLALEDVLHQPRSGLLSKADYYSKHLFLRVLSHQLARGDDHEHDPLLYASPATNHSFANLTAGGAGHGSVTGLPRSSSPGHFDHGHDSRADGGEARRRTWGGKTVHSMRSRTSGKVDIETGSSKLEGLPQLDRAHGHGHAHAQSAHPEQQQHSAHRNQLRNAQVIEELKRGQRVDVRIDPLCIFLLRDGTVISLSRTPDLSFTAPVRDRLRHRDTGLRSTADPALLVHALLDLLVDRALEVVDEYHARIVALEHDVLVHPKMNVVRDLHILQGDLILHKRTLDPIKTVVYGLRRYDVDRCAALLSDEDREKGKQVKGYMSPKAKIYLADVVDHMDYILTSLDMFANISENLINFVFNMASNQMNETMRRLTLATIIFLPLTLLTGYFGMNFDAMWSIHNNSDVFFWELAIPMVILVILLFCWPDLVRMYHFIQKKAISRRAGRTMAQRKHQ